MKVGRGRAAVIGYRDFPDQRETRTRRCNDICVATSQSWIGHHVARYRQRQACRNKGHPDHVEGKAGGRFEAVSQKTGSLEFAEAPSRAEDLQASGLAFRRPFMLREEREGFF